MLPVALTAPPVNKLPPVTDPVNVAPVPAKIPEELTLDALMLPLAKTAPAIKLPAATLAVVLILPVASMYPPVNKLPPVMLPVAEMAVAVTDVLSNTPTTNVP